MSSNNPRYAGLRPWKKGESGNPHGTVQKLPPDLRRERRENQASLIRLLITYFSLTDEQAKMRISGPDSNLLEESIYGMICRAKEGDTNAFKYLTELICGKIPEMDLEANAVEELTPKEKLEAMKHAVKLLDLQIKEKK